MFGSLRLFFGQRGKGGEGKRRRGRRETRGDKVLRVSSEVLLL